MLHLRGPSERALGGGLHLCSDVVGDGVHRIRHGRVLAPDRAGEDITGVIHHSDAGAQYTTIRYAERLADVGAIASTGTVGDSYDNALAESVVGLYKSECVKIDGPFRTVDEFELATLSWVHWFNKQARKHTLRTTTLTPCERRKHQGSADADP